MHRLIKLPFSAEQKAVIAKETDTNAEFIYNAWCPEVDNLERYWMYADDFNLVEELCKLPLGGVTKSQLRQIWNGEEACPLIHGFDFSGACELLGFVDEPKFHGLLCHEYFSMDDGNQDMAWSIMFHNEGEWYLVHSAEHPSLVAGLLHPFFESDELASLLASVSVI